MPFAITGSKYSSTTISSVGTTLVNTAAAVFVSTDFAATRLLGLWDSAGTTFKGMAWARRFVTTSQVELQTLFFDPATGATVTQVVGDIVLVSKNFTESVVAGLAVSGKTVTVTDEMTFGSAASNSVCFYDEGKEIATNSQTKILGGLTVWGKLDSYTARTTSSACDYYSTSNNNGSLFTTGSNANFIMYGGILDGTVSPQYFGANFGTPGRTMIFWGVQSPFDFTSPGAGNSWGSNASRMQLINCYTLTTGGNAIMRRWADGVISGGAYKFPNNTSAPISIFGGDFAGSVTIASPPGTRAIVLDMGNGPALIRCNSAVALAHTFVNLITTDRRNAIGLSGSLTANSLGTSTFSFSDSYSNLSAGTIGVVLNSASAVADSILSSAAIWSPTLLHTSSVGFTVTVNSTSWTFGFKKYGFGVEFGSIAATTYDLGPAGTPDNVMFGGAIFQGADTGVTLSNASANALTAIAHYSDLYDAAINWGTLSVTNAQYPSLSAYPIVTSGTLLDLGAKNLVLNSAAGAAFAINTGTNTITAKATALATTAKFLSIKSTATITAAFTVGGTYIYVNGTLTGATGAPTFTGGTANIGAANTFTFGSAGSIVSMTPAAPSSYVFTGAHTGTLDLRNATASAITVQVPLGTTTTTASNVGGAITVTNPPITLQILRPNIINGSNWIIRNVTLNTEIGSGTTSGGTGINATFTKSTHYNATNVIELRIGYCVALAAKIIVVEQITAPTLDSVNNSPTLQVDYTVYNSMAIDGSAVSGFVADYTNNEVDINIAADFLGQNFMSWWVFTESTLNGLRNFIGKYTLLDAGNIRNETTAGIVLFDNTTATNIKQIDNVRIFRSDAGYPVKNPSTGGGSIDINWRAAVVVVGMTDNSAATALATRIEMDANSSKFVAIKAKTDLIPAIPASSTNITAGTITTVTNLTNAPTAGDLTATMKASVTAAVPTVAAIRTEIDANSTKLDVATSTRLSTAGYVAPPTAASIRTEIDTNSTKLDVATSTRLSTAGYVAPNNAGIAAIPTNPLLTTDARLNTLDANISTRLASASYAAPPTAAAIRTEIDTNSTKLDVATSTRLSTAGYVAPPTAAAIRTEIDTNSTKLTVPTSSLETTVNANTNAAAAPAAVWALVSESGQGYGKQVRDMRATLLGVTTGGGTASEVFRAADGTTTRVTSSNDGTNRTAVVVPGA